MSSGKCFCCLLTAAFLLLGGQAAHALSVSFYDETSIPVSDNMPSVNGDMIDISLQFPPRTGAELMVVRNTGIDFINGTFSNLAHGQTVSLEHDGVAYDFVANYFGGTGNDLVLMWKNVRAVGWGGNSNGELGDGTFTSREEPVPVAASGVLAGKTVIAMAPGYYHSLALCSDGTVAAWGIGYYGNLGNGSTALSNVPVAVDTTSAMSALSGKTVIGVTGGNFHCLALCSDGTLAAWGANFAGQLGDGTQTDRSVPVRINSGALAGRKVVGMAAGGFHSLALCSDGTVAAWGFNLTGQLGNDSAVNQHNLPVEVNTDPGVSALHGKTVTQLTAGGASSLALCSDGSVAFWGGGGGTNGQMVPVTIFTGSISALAAGDAHWLALTDYGSVFVWGSGTGSAVPIGFSISGPPAISIAAGFSHSMALLSDGTLFTWGSSQIINGTFHPMTEAGIRFSKLQSSTSRHYSLALAAYPNPEAVRRNWRQQKFGDPANSGIATDDADPDHDGLPNLLEYALNLDPNAFTRTPMELYPNGTDLQCYYTRSGTAHAAGVTYQVEWSDDLITWSTTGVIEEMTYNGGSTQHLQVTLPAGSGDHRFVRLRVE